MILVLALTVWLESSTAKGEGLRLTLSQCRYVRAHELEGPATLNFSWVAEALLSLWFQDKTARSVSTGIP